MQLAVRIPDELIARLDEHVDRIHFRSRAHLITVIISEWLDEQDEEDDYEDDEEYDE